MGYLSRKYVLKRPKGLVSAKSKTIPDQSMSIKEIVRRFVIGIPVDVKQRQGVYVDQGEHDLEAMSRMDFADKSAMADELRSRNERIIEQQKETERLQRVRERKLRKAKANAPAQGAGIGLLDNTMPVDTKQSTR